MDTPLHRVAGVIYLDVGITRNQERIVRRTFDHILIAGECLGISAMGLVVAGRDLPGAIQRDVRERGELDIRII